MDKLILEQFSKIFKEMLEEIMLKEREEYFWDSNFKPPYHFYIFIFPNKNYKEIVIIRRKY
jgi:hypothetical protein